ncbi:putative BNI4 [Coleophoma cylindrospora]|uniref:Putative BNI4 n=1 Tax=Coleophoma cylindrospora TaxID=1849047 RepID=A0A3D8SG19_9HELO|nr:putative BNI4 [Coleophoma cylindrospora]
MLQTRPSSASGIIQTSQSPSHLQYPSNQSQSKRNSYHGLSNGSGGSYRGQTSTAPIAPYAFTSTPALGQRTQGGPHLRPEQRTISAPIIPTYQHEEGGQAVPRTRYPAAASISTTSTSSSSDMSTMSQHSGSKDDFALTSSTAQIAQRAPRPHSTIITSFTSSLAPPALSSPQKASPDRYRRPAHRRANSSTGSQQPSSQPSSLTSMPNVHNFYGVSTQQSQAANSLQSLNLQMPQSKGSTADDLQLNKQTSDQAAKRYRRRSIHTIDAHDYTYYNGSALAPAFSPQGSRQTQSSPSNGRTDQPSRHPVDPLRSSPIVTVRPTTSHGRNGSSESVNSTRTNSRPSSAAKRESNVPMATVNPAPSSTNSPIAADTTPLKIDQPRLVNIPTRASSSDAAKRIANPSPLSKPMTMSSESSISKDSFASAVSAALQSPAKPTVVQTATSANNGSPAAKQLAALNEKDGKKSKTSRLRRALSFGSAAELRRASAENNIANNASALSAADRSKIRKDRYQDEVEAEQARIAAQQEAGGIGSGIYNGQGNFFSGSTDNLSISSTASSASIMIRKMGKGMKKSTRSLVGLFRPKSVIGVPAADAAVPTVSQAQVSMVTVEAEREKVNVNTNLHDQSGGGTGFPRLERNSADAATAAQGHNRAGSSSTDNSGARRSIVGGEKERAEVLAAVKKGILKRTDGASGNSSPVVRPADSKTPNFNLPQIPNVNDSPISSAPSTPNDDQQGHKRTGSVTLGGEDYFMSALRFKSDSKSVPSTPQGAILKRNATFSPRIQFHDTWPSGEYDRRGEISTCNRLTPMLAQQIKEELNTFKMEMEVHETSKIYTHFF